ncbi:DExH-box splicing factor binding site-domain-containing protein [Absidia repens]|uniref:DExH-box splicing factor binding site-domain-containing protein n=1 Tax=Absidia repens TaxID=90262 RepID=A0A1X2IWR6_9FUNG|nr:DExH-box splicing factor binding site-domain-containing protein [Absidia repens]
MSSNGDSSEKKGFAMNMNGAKKRLPLGSKPKAPFVSNNRRRVELDDDDDDSDDDGHNQVELLQGFEGNKATELNPKEEVKPLSIAPLANTDWRALARQKKQLYMPTRGMDPSLSSSASVTPQEPEIIGQTVSTFGLQVPTKTTSQETTAGTFDQLTETTTTTAVVTNTTQQDQPVKSLEAQAIEAIIQESTEGDNEKENGPALVIPADETESFRNDVQNRAEDTTMEDYENVPVEEFGAALLRGLGWNQGEGIGRNRKNTTPPVMTPVKQRDALLGLGAKPQEVEKDKKDDKKRRNRKADYDYKETSLFKKISKRRMDDKEERHSNMDDDEDHNNDYRSRRRDSPSRSSNSSSRDRERSSSSRSSSSSSRSSRDRRDYHKSGHRRSRSRSRSPPRRSGSHSHRSSSNSSSNSRSSSKHYNDRSRD